MATGGRNSHKDLILWRKAMELATEAHRLTRLMPRHEMFGLVSQVRRAAVSIPSNIAEGSARRSTREFLAFLHIARGSSAELETQLQVARNVGYLAEQDLEPALVRLDEVGRLLNAVIAGLRRRQADAS
ncbi:MAG: four helix bundle protein [Steroidobacteraceae bacterium]